MSYTFEFLQRMLLHMNYFHRYSHFKLPLPPLSLSSVVGALEQVADYRGVGVVGVDLGLCSQGCSVSTRGPAEEALASPRLPEAESGSSASLQRAPPPSVCFLCSRGAFQAPRQLSWRGHGRVSS